MSLCLGRKLRGRAVPAQFLDKALQAANIGQ